MNHLICLRSMFYCRKLTSPFLRNIWTFGKLKSNSAFLRAFNELESLSGKSHLKVFVLVWNNQMNILGAKARITTTSI